MTASEIAAAAQQQAEGGGGQEEKGGRFGSYDHFEGVVKGSGCVVDGLGADLHILESDDAVNGIEIGKSAVADDTDDRFFLIDGFFVIRIADEVRHHDVGARE